MIHVGLCGWTTALRTYFETFPVVEVQQTFYEPPDARTMLRWREQSPPGFEFTLKAWQLITHRSSSRTYRRLKTPLTDAELAGAGAFQDSDTVRRGWAATEAAAKILRATMILFQCPASFRPEPENLVNMRRFFAETPRPEGVRFLFEPRGTAWTDDIVREMCAELDLVHVADPFARDVVTPGLVYWRLHGIGTHYHVYTDAELRTLAKKVPPSGDAYVMFNNVPRVGDAQRFLSIVSRR